MMEWFDMGKYDFFVWGSILVFIVAIAFDLISVNLKKKQMKRLIMAKSKRHKNQTASRRNQT